MDELWSLCFPYCEPGIHDPLTVKDGERVVSMLNRMPMRVCGLNAVYIYGVATHPDYRRRGLASRLIRDALAAPGYDIAALVPEHPPMAAFYKRFGFVCAGCLPGDGRDVLVYPGKDLTEEVYGELTRVIKNFEDEE